MGILLDYRDRMVKDMLSPVCSGVFLWSSMSGMIDDIMDYGLGGWTDLHSMIGRRMDDSGVGQWLALALCPFRCYIFGRVFLTFIYCAF